MPYRKIIVSSQSGWDSNPHRFRLPARHTLKLLQVTNGDQSICEGQALPLLSHILPLPFRPPDYRVGLSPRSEELDAYLRTVRYSSCSFTELVQRAPFQVVVRVNKFQESRRWVSGHLLLRLAFLTDE